MRIQARWITTSRVFGLGIYSHNRWRDIGRGFTVWVGPLAFVVTPAPRGAKGGA